MSFNDSIFQALSLSPSYEDIRELVSSFHGIALTYLRGKVASSDVANRFGISLDDLAFDCIADLFKRDDQGLFVTLKEYFESINYQNMTEEQLLGACRRLVFSRVNQELYRLHKEHDPDLHRIIRNIKDTVPQVPSVRLEEKNGVPTLLFGGSSNHLPTMSPEILECYLTESVTTSMTIREILLAAEEVFASQEVYQRSYPLTGFALLVRAAFTNLDLRESDHTSAPDGLKADELRRFVNESIDDVSRRMEGGYVGKGKVTDLEYAQYFQTITEILCAEYVSDDGAGSSYFDNLAKQINGLTEKEYRAKHRTLLEYLTKLTRKDFLEKIRRELE